MKAMFYFSAFAIITLLISCGNPVSTVQQQVDSIVQTVDTQTVTTPEVNYTEAIIGKWEYVETQMTIGDVTINNKVMYHWSLEFKKDGTFHEENQLSEGDEILTLDNTYTITDKELKRKGAVLLTIVELTADKLIVDSFSAKLVYNKVK